MRHSVKDQILVEGKSLLFGYPKFIFSGNDDKHLDGIPVFVFHTIDPSLFESQLLYLKSNGYKTLSVHEFYDALSNPGTLKNNKAVLLTIDDARSSVWRYAYPLLKKYEANAAIFIIPGLTEKGALRKNLSDVWNGKSNFEEIDKSDPSDETLCTWEEISEMYNSGIINIESHSLFHREIFSSSKLIDFYTDHKSKVPYRFPASPYLELPDSERNINADDYLGLPLFETSPLMSALQQLIITEAFKDLCRKIYKEKKPDSPDIIWQNRIKSIINQNLGNEKYFYIKADSKQDISDDLRKAKLIIQSQLDSNAGNHFCLPWTKGNDDTINIIKEIGIKTCFWGVLSSKKINKPGDNPYFISRIKNDFIFRLPGKDRKGLFSIYGFKLKRRHRKQQVY